FYWRGPERIVDVIGPRKLSVNDVAFSRDADDRWRKVDKIAADPRRTGIPVVDDDDLAPIRCMPIAAQQPPAIVGDSEYARAVRPHENGNGLATAPLDMRVAGLPAETVDFVVADDGPAALTDDHAAGLLNQYRIALAHLAAGAAYVIKTSRTVLRRRWYESALRLRRR